MKWNDTAAEQTWAFLFHCKKKDTSNHSTNEAATLGPNTTTRPYAFCPTSKCSDLTGKCNKNVKTFVCFFVDTFYLQPNTNQIRCGRRNEKNAKVSYLWTCISQDFQLFLFSREHQNTFMVLTEMPFVYSWKSKFLFTTHTILSWPHLLLSRKTPVQSLRPYESIV